MVVQVALDSLFVPDDRIMWGCRLAGEYNKHGTGGCVLHLACDAAEQQMLHLLLEIMASATQHVHVDVLFISWGLAQG